MKNRAAVIITLITAPEMPRGKIVALLAVIKFFISHNSFLMASLYYFVQEKVTTNGLQKATAL